MSVAKLGPADPRTIAGFRLVNRLGEGGQGVVYLGRAEDGTRAAVKVIRPELSASAESRARFAREVAAARQVPSHCTARILDYGLDSSACFIASEYIEGPTLDAAGIQRGDDLYRLAIATATALTAIHGAGVIHRDFKPSNVILGNSGIRVIDFGIARDQSASSTLTRGAAIGTPQFMAPEQVAGSAALTTAIDLFAWAGVMVYAATGAVPFDAGSVTGVFNQILREEPDLSGMPDSLRPLVAACLAKEPRNRPAASALLMKLLGDPGDVSSAIDEGTRIGESSLPVRGLDRGYVPTQPAVPRTPAVPHAPATAPRQGSPWRRPVTILAWLALCAALIAGGWAGLRAFRASQGPKVAVPAALSGVWLGILSSTQVTGDNGQEVFTLSLTAGLHDGSDDQELAGCASTDIPQSLAGLTLTLSQHGTTGNCGAASAKVTLSSPGVLNVALFSPQNSAAVMYSGQLRRIAGLPRLASGFTGTWTGHVVSTGSVTLNLINTQEHSAGTAVYGGNTCPVAVVASGPVHADLHSGEGTQNDVNLSGTPACDGTFRLTLFTGHRLYARFSGSNGDAVTVTLTRVG